MVYSQMFFSIRILKVIEPREDLIIHTKLHLTLRNVQRYSINIIALKIVSSSNFRIFGG